MKKLSYMLVGLLLICLSACTDNSYLNAIPGESTALISMDPARISGVNNVAVLKTLLMSVTGFFFSNRPTGTLVSVPK